MLLAIFSLDGCLRMDDAAIIFGEKIWSRHGIWVARITGAAFVIIGLFTMVRIINLQNNATVNNMHASSSSSGSSISSEKGQSR